MAWASNKRTIGMQICWQQADEAGITDPVEQADFLLRRLYPEMPEAWFRDVVTRLGVLRDSGQWHGFARPEVIE